jgi:proteic killer suppression protein
MIKSFGKKYLEECFRNGQCTRVPAELRKRILRKLDMMHAAISLEDLAKAPGNKLHRLKGDRQDKHALHVSGKWCLVFRYDKGDFYDVALEQYH